MDKARLSPVGAENHMNGKRESTMAELITRREGAIGWIDVDQTMVDSSLAAVVVISAQYER